MIEMESFETWILGNMSYLLEYLQYQCSRTVFLITTF